MSFISWLEKTTTPWTWRRFLHSLQIPISPMIGVLYMFFDKNKTGHMTFYQYMVYNWHFLSASDDTLASYVFPNVRFQYALGTLHIFEVKYLINAIHSFKAGMDRWLGHGQARQERGRVLHHCRIHSIVSPFPKDPWPL